MISKQCVMSSPICSKARFLAFETRFPGLSITLIESPNPAKICLVLSLDPPSITRISTGIVWASKLSMHFAMNFSSFNTGITAHTRTSMSSPVMLLNVKVGLSTSLTMPLWAHHAETEIDRNR